MDFDELRRDSVHCPRLTRVVNLSDLSVLDSPKLRHFLLEVGKRKLAENVAHADGLSPPLKRKRSCVSMTSLASEAAQSLASLSESR